MGRPVFPGAPEMSDPRALAAVRDRIRRGRSELAFLGALRRLPRPVARFQWRARRLAGALGDDWSILSSTRPSKLALLLELARGRRNVVELGTATGWTALSLLLADPQRTVTSYDVEARSPRERYLDLAGSTAAARLTLVTARADSGPGRITQVEFLYIDSSHTVEATLSEFRAWRPVLTGGGLVVFDDFDHPAYPGVRQAVERLELAGQPRGGLFVHRAGG